MKWGPGAGTSLEGSRPAASGMNANENWADLSTVSSARERGWSAVGELASRCRDLSCSELSSGVAEMRQSFLGAEMQRPPAHQLVTNFTN